MLAKFEKLSLNESRHLSLHKYVNLLNLPHWHMEYELIFADQGKANVMVGNEQYLLEEGNVILINCEAVHNIQSVSESIISVVKIDQNVMKETFHDDFPVCPLIRTSLPMKEIFSELMNEHNSGKQYSRIICDCILIKTLAELLSSCRTESVKAADGNEKFKALLKIIEERYAYITFDEAAEFMCYSKPYFSRYFSKISGMSFSSYVNIIRIAEAITMMRKENSSNITEIAHAIGFGTIRHFNRIFKELTGYTPSTLPDDYVFIKYRYSKKDEGFDPTLSSPAIV